MTSSYQQLFTAFAEARSALDSLSGRSSEPDTVLAHDPDYRRLHRSGMVIAHIGGGPAIQGAIVALADDDRTSAALLRYWAGMETWPRAASH